MLERLRNALVNSFAGAIAVGWLFAEGIQHLVAMFATPISYWAQQQARRSQMSGVLLPDSAPFPYQLALPQMLSAAALLAIAFALLAWLYFPAEGSAGDSPVEEESPDA